MKKYFFKILLRTLLIIGFLWFMIIIMIIFSPSAKAQELSVLYEHYYLIKDAEYLPAWEDNVFNLENEEYLVEVLFNYFEKNMTVPEIIDNWEHIQYLFIIRYKETCKKESLDWAEWYKVYREAD